MDELERLILEIEAAREGDAHADGDRRAHRSPDAILDSLRAFAFDPRIRQCLTRLQDRDPALRIHYMRTCMLHRLKELHERRSTAAGEPRTN